MTEGRSSSRLAAGSATTAGSAKNIQIGRWVTSTAAAPACLVRIPRAPSQRQRLHRDVELLLR
jgi:hypothetical protein